jgi:hypothetical protein
MSIAVVKAFRPTVEACWITTYNLDLGLFDGFLLSRLGEPPLNVVVLADGIRHDRALEALPVDETWRIDRINRRWLLRPVHHTAAFHPKTLLFVEPSTTTLLVGSGNLSDSGLDSGSEVFTTFTTNDDEGRAAIAGWVHWMRGVVDRTADELVDRRFTDLLRRLPDLPAPGVAFVHNLEAPLLSQMLSVAPTPVDELLLTAPFFDEHLEATTRLINEVSPRRVSLFLGELSSLDGAALQRLSNDVQGAFQLHRYTPELFIHAKLLAAVGSNGRGVLLSGSANLSLAALAGAVSEDSWANYEVGVLAELDADTLRAVFTNPPQLDAGPVDLDAFADHTFRRNPEAPRPPLRIRSATRIADGAIALEVVGQAPNGAVVTDGSAVAPLDETVPLTGRLVWITHEGHSISNRAIVTELAELEAQLRQRTQTDSGRPAELYLGDTKTPLGAILAAMHQSFIMDIAETEAVGAAERAADDDSDDGSGTKLWDRLAKDTLNYDPRASNYTRSAHRAGADSPLLELLAMMLSRAPHEVRELYSNVIPFPVPDGEEPGEEQADDRPRHRWSESTRIRVRARNVLRRWADAIGDKRLLWIDPSAPLTNFSAMVDAICVLRSINRTAAASGLTDEDLDDLTDRTMTAILSATAGSDGHVEGLSDHTVATATVLVVLALRPGTDYRARLLHWQPRLRPLQDRGLLQATSLAAYYHATLFDSATDAGGIQDRIEAAKNFIDDAEWARRLELELGLESISYGQPSDRQQLDALVHIDGIDQPLVDPRTLRLVNAVCDYRGASSVALYDRQGRWRLVIVPGETAVLRADWIDERVVESVRAIDQAEIDRLVEAGSSLSELFLPEHRAA